MNIPKIADYTTGKVYHQNYVAKNREAINARKREWRKARKLKAQENEWEKMSPTEKDDYIGIIPK